MSNSLILKKVKGFLSEYVIIYAIVTLFVFLTFASDVFFAKTNLLNILRQVSMIGIIAVGMFFVLVGGNIDISVGANVAVSGIIFSGGMYFFKMSPVLAGILAIISGVMIGAINGVLVAYLRIPALIATLGMSEVARGLVYVLTGAYPINKLPTSIGFIGRGYVFGIPWPVVFMVIVYAIAFFVSQKTKFGRFVFASGGNEEAAHLSGINVKHMRLYTFMICGFLASISSIILVSRLNSGQPTAGIGWDFEAIIATIIGGVSITGGRGKVLGVLLGTILIGILTNGMTLLSISSYYQSMIKGLVLIFAIGLDVYKNRKR